MPKAQTPISGLFSHPCGAWVAPYRMKSGLLWWRPLAAATRRAMGLAR